MTSIDETMSADLMTATHPAQSSPMAIEPTAGDGTTSWMVGRRWRDRWWAAVGRFGSLGILGSLIIGMSIARPETFATSDNAVNILNQSSLGAIIAIGLTFVLLTGEFDLSIGNVAGLAGVVALVMMRDQSMSIPLAIGVAALVGAAIGIVNGLIVTLLRVHALVATLGVGTIAVGVNYAVSDGRPVGLAERDAFININLGRLWGIPYPVFVMAGIAAAAWILLNRTVLGQAMQAVGGNEVAARLSGIRVQRVRIVAFTVCGALAGLTGVLLATRTGSAAVTAGDSYLLSSFAAAFFGSAVLRDGEFHVVGTLIGVITVTVGFNAIALLGVDTFWQFLFQGGLLIVGVGVGSLARKQAQPT